MASNKTSSGAILGAIIGTVAAAGGGFAFGALILKQPPQSPAQTAASPAKAPNLPDSEVVPLAPIVTNLGNPSDLFVRLQAAIVLEPDARDTAALAAKVGDDIVVYLRTVSVTEIQGATGFQYLREDLKKRAIELGGGKIRDLLLTGFVVE
ncbi:MAG: flagellar basal body-associated FliL family protein [Rhodomicrobium sp.]